MFWLKRPICKFLPRIADIYKVFYRTRMATQKQYFPVYILRLIICDFLINIFKTLSEKFNE